MKKIKLIILSILLSSFSSFAQETEDVMLKFWNTPQITFDPLGLFSLTAVRAGLDLPLNKDFEIAFQASYINGLIMNGPFRNENISLNNHGYRFNTEIRLFTKNKDDLTRRTYIAFNVFYKHMNNQKERWLWNEGGNYKQLISYNEIKHVVGSHFKIGWKKSNNAKFSLNYYVGIGSRLKFFSEKDIPEDFIPEFSNRWNPFNMNYEGVFFSLTGGLLIGIPINSKYR